MSVSGSLTLICPFGFWPFLNVREVGHVKGAFLLLCRADNSVFSLFRISPALETCTNSIYTTFILLPVNGTTNIISSINAYVADSSLNVDI